MKRKVPRLRSDEAAESFLDQDLSDLDFAQFRLMHFEFETKTAQLNLRLPKALLDAVKQRAKERGIPYARFVREAMEDALARRQPPRR